jgi:hypothetical protein
VPYHHLTPGLGVLVRVMGDVYLNLNAEGYQGSELDASYEAEMPEFVMPVADGSVKAKVALGPELAPLDGAIAEHLI